ncbi:phage tail protein [Aeromonas enterica]
MTPPPEQGAFLHALHAALKQALPESLHKRLDSWMEGGTVKLEPKNMGDGGYIIARLSYQAVFTIEGLPFRDVDPAMLLAVAAAWIQEHDVDRDMRGLDDPGYTVTPLDEHTADMELTVDFSEPLSLVPDVDGLIHWQGQRWAVAPYEVWVAEDADITVSIAHD